MRKKVAKKATKNETFAPRLKFPRDAWKVPRLIGQPESNVGLPGSWMAPWYSEQQARLVPFSELFRDLGNLLEARDDGVPGIFTNLMTDDFYTIIRFWDERSDGSIQRARFVSILREHQHFFEQ